MAHPDMDKGRDSRIDTAWRGALTEMEKLVARGLFDPKVRPTWEQALRDFNDEKVLFGRTIEGLKQEGNSIRYKTALEIYNQTRQLVEYRQGGFDKRFDAETYNIVRGEAITVWNNMSQREGQRKNRDASVEIATSVADRFSKQLEEAKKGLHLGLDKADSTDSEKVVIRSLCYQKVVRMIQILSLYHAG